MSGLIINPYAIDTGSPATSVARWRLLNLTTTNSPITDGAAAIAELEFRETPGGANVATGGTASASNSYPGLPASNAFDGNPSTLWGTNGGAGANSTIAYQCPAPVSINEISMTARGDAAGYGVSQTPRSLRVQSSPDGTTWTTEWTVADTGAWADGETKVFTRP